MRSAAPRVIGFLGALVLWSMLVGIPNDPVGILIWGWFATVLMGVHHGFWRDWWPIVAALAAYWLARGVTDNVTDLLSLPVHVIEPIRFDRWLSGLFGGPNVTPTEQLQAAWCGDPCLKTGDPRWWDVALNTVYASHFYVAIVLGVALWVRNKVTWRDWMNRYLTLLFVGLAGYLLYPTAPPWMGVDAARITSRGWNDLGLERQNMVLVGMSNQVAAMPSLHTGISALVAFWAISRLGTRLRWLLLAYPVLMGLALCYFGEHYVIDEIAGIAAAEAVMLGWRFSDRSRVRRRSSAVTGTPA